MVTLPASGWTAYGTAPIPAGYRWKSPSRAEPVRRVIVRANRIRIYGGGASWGYTLNEPAQGAVAVWLRFGTAAPWCASAPRGARGSRPRPPPTITWIASSRHAGRRHRRRVQPCLTASPTTLQTRGARRYAHRPMRTWSSWWRPSRRRRHGVGMRCAPHRRADRLGRLSEPARAATAALLAAHPIDPDERGCRDAESECARRLRHVGRRDS